VEDPLNFPIRLDDKLASLAATVGTGQYAPTAQAEAVGKILVGETDAQLAKLGTIWQTDLPAFNRLVGENKVPAIAFKADEKKAETTTKEENH
ncbi:MAG TPA: hypothetical protein VKA53_05155, partial [Thermoanaerobaculia bacterium]|nr:hypothetical protein [Thermoanaerobaculia bacterium]